MEKYIDKLDVKKSTRLTEKEESAFVKFASEKNKRASSAMRVLIVEGLKSRGYLN